MCAKHRELALEKPVDIWKLREASTQPRILAPYSFKWGKFFVSITYEAYKRPHRWHAQATILEEIGEGEWGSAQEALLAVSSWTDRDRAEAIDILGEALAPEMVSSTQSKIAHWGLWSLHLIVEDAKGEERGHRVITIH